MKKVQKTSTIEFRREAVRLAQTSGKPIAQVALELAIFDTSIHQWRWECQKAATTQPRKREPSQRQVENERLTEHIAQAFQRGRQVYGSPRVHAELRAQGISCGKHRVARRTGALPRPGYGAPRFGARLDAR